MKLEGWGKRLGDVLDREVGQDWEPFAQKVGVRASTLKDYVAERTYPKLNILVNILMETGESFEWLAFGHRSDGDDGTAPKQGIRVDVLANSIEEAKRLDTAFQQLSPEKRLEAQAQAIAAIYNATIKVLP